MEAVNRVHTAEDALGEFSAEAEAERAKAVDAKSAMKSREFGDKLRELQDRVERAESDRDAAVERAKTAEEARFKAESELERSRSSPAGKDLADARRRLRQAEDRHETPRRYQPSPRRPRRPSRGERGDITIYPSSSRARHRRGPERGIPSRQTQLGPPSRRAELASSLPSQTRIELAIRAKDPASIPNERSRRVVHHPDQTRVTTTTTRARRVFIKIQRKMSSFSNRPILIPATRARAHAPRTRPSRGHDRASHRG